MVATEKFRVALKRMDFKENMMKLSQYFAKIIYERLGFTNYSETALKANKLSYDISLARKLLRFGAPIGVIISLVKKYRSNNKIKTE